MKRRHILQLCLALLLCCPLLLKAQSNQTIFQCWINDSKDEAVYGTVNGEDINMSLDVGSLNPGVHFYNIRAYETVGNKVKWGSLFRYLFCIPKYAGEDAPNNLKGYEYWLDDDYEHRVTAAANGDEKEVLHSVDVSALAPGVHFYNMRTQDEDGMWSTLYRYLFCIPKAASTSPNNLKGYEYWIDNDYEHRVTTDANGDEKEVLHSVDVSALSPGIHFYNMRTQDEDGIWGTVNRYLFSIPYPRQDEAPRLITGYSYAFNDGTPTNVEFDSPVEEYELTKSFAVPQPQPPMVIDDDCGFIFDEDENTATLSRNINMSFALFFKDQSDAMCSPVTTEFTVGDVRTEDIQIITCPGSANIANHENGGFSAIRFDVVTKMNIKFIADGNCSMRLYSPYSQLLDGYDASTLTAGVTKELEEGTYYALVYGNTQDVVLSIGFADMNVLKPTIAFDMETYIATISCKTAGATIYYTIDGNTPTAESTLYKEPFVIDRNCTIKAIATWAGGLTGPVASKEIDIFDAAAPMIARDGNNITITCETAGATIYYTTDGTEPTAESTAYTGSFALSKSCTIKAIALKEGYNASVVTSYKFTYVQPVVTTPEIAHEGNTITITCNTEGATIYYTSDGLEPTAGSTAYTEAFEVTENCTIKAIAVKEGYKNSQIVSLTVDWFVVADVTFAAAGSSLSLSTTTEGATISYKVDDLEWATYTEALSMEGTHTVQAYATKEGYTKSNVTTYNFFYERPVVTTPEIAYEGNTITITCNTEDATVYYTIDGTVPTSESAVYTTPFTVSENCTVRAFAVKEGHVDSQMAILEIVLNVGGYAIFNSSTGTLTFKYGPIPSGDNVFETENTEFSWNASWDCSKLRTVIFDSSYAEARPTSTACWFNGAQNLTEIRNLEYLNTVSVTDMSRMFQECKKLSSIDVSHFDTGNVTGMYYMFHDCSSLTSLDVSHFDTSNVSNMNCMFWGCSSLTSLDVSHFDTQNVKSMNQMFYGCSNLTNLDVSHFNTSNVTNMSSMFFGCSRLKTLDVSLFVTKNVTNMYYMFHGCSSLTSLDVSHFDTSNVSNMNCMFWGCSSLTSLDVSHFDTSNVIYMAGMFSDCSSLTSLDVSNFDTHNVVSLGGPPTENGYAHGGMFTGCENLTTLNLSSFNTEKVETMSMMFYGCKKLETIYVGEGWTTENLTNGDFMFPNCFVLVGGNGTKYNGNYVDMTYAHIDGGANNPGYFSLYGEIVGPCGYAIYDSGTATLTFKYGETLLTGNVFETDNTTFTFESPAPWDYENLRSVVFDASYAQARPTSTACWFCNATNLTQITGIEYLNTSEVTGMRGMFDSCKSLTSLDLSHFDTRNVTDMAGMFENCNSLTSLDMSSFDTRNVTDMGWMFFNCNALKSINLSSFNTSNVTDMSRMFYYCNGLEILNISHFDTGNVTNMAYMFSFCNSLSEIDVTHFKTDKVTSMEAMFQRCVKLKNVDVSHFETSNVTNMSYMFSLCSSLTDLNLCRFNTAKVTNMNYMFQNCTNLKTIYAGLGWTTDNVTSSYNMFADCSSLVGGKGTSCLFYGYYYSDKTYARIDGRNSASGFLTGLFIGDVNDNGVVDLVDAVAMVNYILGTPSSSFKTISADINDDGEIDVFDVTMLINMILADSDEPASSRRAYDDTQEREPILLTSYGNSVYMGIDYPERFTAFQFDVTISSGVDLSDVLMVSNDNNHSLTFTKIGENKYTVIGISLNNDLLKSANGKLVEMILSDQLNGDVMVSNIHFVTPEEEEMYFCDGMLCVVTGIASNSEECEEIIYDLSGRKQTKSRGLLGRGVYVINGKKTVIK